MKTMCCIKKLNILVNKIKLTLKFVFSKQY